MNRAVHKCVVNLAESTNSQCLAGFWRTEMFWVRRVRCYFVFREGRTEGEATMASTLLKLGTINNLAPGATTTNHWNNASPATAVWYIQAVPLVSSFTANPVQQSV